MSQPWGYVDRIQDKVGERVYDLAPLLTAKNVSKEQQRDMGFVLAILAKVANVSVYQEHFYRNAFVGAEVRLKPENMRGTLPELVDAIAKTWRYSVRRVDDDYLFWSPTWALDRQSDIPERQLAPLRKILAQRGGSFINDDRVRMATIFSWPQVCITLDLALPESAPEPPVPHGSWAVPFVYYSLRLQGFMTNSQIRDARSPSGLLVSALSPRAFAALAGAEGFRLGGNDQIAGVEDDKAASLMALKNARLRFKGKVEGELGDPPLRIALDSAEGAP